MTGEYILYAAIKVLNTELNTDVFTGTNHGQCIKQLKASCQQGFLADSCSGTRFVDRVEALKIAIEAGQVINKHAPKNKLCTEDLAKDRRFLGRFRLE